MGLPGFSAEASLQTTRRHFRNGRGRPVVERSGAVIPSVPLCENCDDLLDYCATHGGRPRAACAACARGDCDFGGDESRCYYDSASHRICSRR